MRLDFCVACGKRDVGLEHHHLIPRSAGGSDDEENLITLCHECHGKIHGMLRRDIRKLTKEGMARRKAAGIVFGNPNIADHGLKASLRNSEEADKFKLSLAPIIDDIRLSGITTFRGIANELNRRGVKSRYGNTWQAPAVHRMVQRIGKEKGPEGP